MQRQFCTRRGAYRRDGLLHLPGVPAHLWPFARALVATLDLAGVPQIPQGFNAEAEIAARLRTLERYWDPRGPRPAYSSDVIGGSRYYDDNAWVGLALVQRERMHPGAGGLERVRQLSAFAAAGWDTRRDVPSPGGVFWVEQGRGAGASNHDRNTVSNAPNAQLGLHLAELGAAGRADPAAAGPDDMYAWVNAALDDGSGGTPGTGLFWDKIRGDGSIDRTRWSYNQGSMVGLNVLLARVDGDGDALYLSRAEAIARRALRHYAGRYERQPAAFNAIFFRNLLQLHAATGDDALRREIIAAMRGYADRAWSQRRDRHDRFRLSGSRPTLLDQSGIAQVLALLAWDPRDYGKLA